MGAQNSAWFQLLKNSQPVSEQYDVACHLGHAPNDHSLIAIFVFARLNSSRELELLVERRSGPPGSARLFGFIGGSTINIHETSLVTAARGANERYVIAPDAVSILGIRYTGNHGCPKTYTYIFAEYNPEDGKTPIPRTSEFACEWFPMDRLPSSPFAPHILEDGQMLDQTLSTDILPLLIKKAKSTKGPRNPDGESAAQNHLEWHWSVDNPFNNPESAAIKGGSGCLRDPSISPRTLLPIYPLNPNAGVFFPEMPQEFLPDGFYTRPNPAKA